MKKVNKEPIAQKIEMKEISTHNVKKVWRVSKFAIQT